MEDRKTRWPEAGHCALPLIGQKLLDEWGTGHLRVSEVSSLLRLYGEERVVCQDEERLVVFASKY
jgi:hypothetical protein